MKVLVTGGYGLVGHSLQKIVESSSNTNDFYFLSKGDCDLRDINQVDSLFERVRPDVVVHLASKVGGVYDNLNGNYTYLLDNTRININIVDACNRYHVKRLINILSTCIFPDTNVTYPLTSDQLHNGLPHDSNIGYAYSKRVLHLLSSLLSKNSTLKVINLTPTNVYGEYDNYNLKSSHVIPGLIHKIYLSKKKVIPLEIYGSGKAVRQFLYSDDLARVILKFIDLEIDKNEISIVVSPPETSCISIENLIKLLCNTFDFTGTIKYNVTYTDGQLKKTTDNSELVQYLPDFQFTPFKTGIKNTIEFFVTNYNTIRK